MAKKLALHFKSIDNLAEARIDSLIEVEEIGEKIAVSIIEYFKDPLNLQIIGKLKFAGLNFKIKEDKDYLISTKLDGLSFVVSGVFKNFSRDEIKAAIARNGGRVLSGISSKTTYVIAGDNMGPGKLEKAGKLKIQILSENDFIKMLE